MTLRTAAPGQGAGPARGPATAGPAGPSPRLRRAAVRLLLLLVLVAAVGLLRTAVAGPVRISSDSMQPTLQRGDVVLVRHGVDLADLSHGDLVTFSSPADGAETLKRVVALPGETVVIRDAVLYVDERPVEEPYVDAEAIDAYYSAKVTVPPGTVWVLGDHRANSVDSRVFGPVPAGDLHGRVLVRLWPPVR